MVGDGWARMPLGEFVTLQRGHDLPDEQRRPGNVPILGSFGITGWHDEAKASGPGVTIGRSGASFGVASYSPVDFWPLNTALYVIDFHGNDERFAYYFLKCFDFQGYNSCSAQPSLNRNYIHPVLVDVPPPSEQRAIARILGALDDKIELNRRMNETLQAMARALFKSWFVDFDPVHANAEGRITGLPKQMADLFPGRFKDSEMGEIPEQWTVGTILEQAELLSGGTPKTDREDYWDGGVPWASAGDVSQCDQTFLVSTERTVTEKGLKESATQLIPAFSTVVVARGATTGRMVLFGRAMAMNQTCYALTSKIKTPFALHCHLRQMINDLVHAAHGSVFNTITTSTFNSGHFVLPPGRVLVEFEKCVSPFFSRILANSTESQALTALRDTLLPKLISGELRVKDAERQLEATA